MLHGVLSWTIGAPLLLAQTSPTPDSFTVLDALTALVWLIGFVFEAGGDAQLTRFKPDPDNQEKLPRTGLWAYTRHPDYFGDVAQWWGFYPIALAAGGWWTIYSPVLMTFLRIRVSGTGVLENTLANTKPGYLEYRTTTTHSYHGSVVGLLHSRQARPIRHSERRRREESQGNAGRC